MANKQQPVEIPAPVLQNSLDKLRQFPSDIRLIRKEENLGLTQLARTLSISKQQLWRWQTGKGFPREALTLLSILSWAGKLTKG